MGHERVGVLPRSRRWRAIVEQLAEAASSESAAQRLATATLENVRHRFDDIQEDEGVQAALGYVLGLATAHLPGNGTCLVPRIDFSENPSAVTLVQQLARWVEGRAQSQEYATLATRAAADTIAYWTRDNSKQAELFAADSTTAVVWGKAASGSAFSELTRVFFAKFTERYLNYFLEREASAQIPSLRERELFSVRLQQHADDLSRHAFETTKIAQSFAAGWFNNNARESKPTDESVRGFLAFAFGKIRAELQREKAE